MADVVFKVVIDGKEHILSAAKDTKKLKSEMDSLDNSQRKAQKSASNFQNTQNKGVLGTANNARNFSKLSQTIGSGDNGLVGAYATLAANTFAVVAAFTALQKASNALKIMSGLEAQGARLGKTLSITAQNIRDITADALSMADAMASTAQLTAAGFDDSQIKSLANVAKDASGALGRDLNDAMDRLTRGVTKLEPELLDELGLMTKLDEASQKYATQLNKSATALTAAEKRQAFMNSVIEEGTRKFGGIGDAVDEYNAYTRLAATATDLFNNVMGTVATVLSPVAELFASNQWLMAGAVTMYAASIKNDLLPFLSTAVEKQKELLAERGDALKQSAAKFADQASALDKIQVRDSKGQFEKSRSGSVLRELVSDMEEGEVSAGRFNTALSTLNEEYEQTGRILQNTKSTNEEYLETLRSNRELQLDAINRTKELASNFHRQTAAQHSLNAVQAASNITLGTLGSTIRTVTIEIRAQNAALREANAITLSTMSGIDKATTTVSLGVSRGFAVMSTAVRAFGAALLNMLPFIGQAIFVFGLLSSALSYLKDLFSTDEQKAYNKVMEEYNSILNEASVKQQEYNRATELAKTSSSAQMDALRLTGNAVKELTDKYNELQEARAAAEDSSLLDKLKKSLTGTQNVESEAISNALFNAGNRMGDYFSSGAYQANLNNLAATYGTVNEETKAFITQQVNQIDAMESNEERVKASAELIQELGDRYDTLSVSVENLSESFKNLETTTTQFIQSAAISTPVDKLLKDIQGTTSAVEGLRIEMLKGAVTAEEYVSAISAIGSQSSALVGNQAQNIADLERARKAMASADENNDFSGYVRQRQAVSTLSKEILNNYQKELLATQALVRQNQMNLRSIEKQKEMQEAIFKKVQDQLGVGAKAYLAREEHAEKVRDFQVKELQVQRTLLEVFHEREKARIRELQDQLDSLELERNKLDVIKNITAQYAQQASLRATGENRSLSEASGSLIIEAMKNAPDITQETDAEIAKLAQNIRDATAASDQLGDSIASLRSQEAVILAENLSAAEKAARALGEEFQLTKKFFEQLNEYSTAIRDTNNAIDSFNRLVTLRNGQIANSYSDILKGYETARESLINQLALKAKQAELDANIASATLENNQLVNSMGEAIRDNLSNIEKEYFNEKLKTEALLRQEEVLMRLKVLELAMFDATKQGVEWQEQALSYLEKEAELRAKNLEMQNQISASQRRVERIQSGMPETEQSGKNEAVIAALESFRAAKLAAQVRMASIDAEYALMHAQKVALEQELLARRTMLKAIGISDEYLRPLDAAVSTLRGIDVSALRDLAIRGVQLSVEVEAQKVTEAVAEANQRFFFDEKSPLGRFLTMQADNKDLESVTAAAMRELAKPFIAESKIVFGSLETGIDEIAAETKKELQAITELKTPAVQSAEHLGVIRGIMENGGSMVASLPGDSLRAAVDAVAAEGFRVSEGPGYGGTPSSGHSRNSRHYSGNAYDINIGKGNVEANDPVMRAQMDNIAKRLVDQGFVVLWNGQRMTQAGNTALRGGQHKDHIHVEDRGNRTPRESTVVSTASADAARVDTPIASNRQGSSLEELRGDLAKTYGSAAQGLSIVLPDLKTMVSQIIQANDLTVDFRKNLEVLAETQGFSKTVEGLVKFREGFQAASMDIVNLAQRMGPEGEILLAFSEGVNGLTTSASEALAVFDSTASTTQDKMLAVGSVITGVLQSIGSISQASADMRVNAIDQEIAAEQKRDGKSVASQKKIEALEKKKDQIKRKQFNMNKKLMMAEAVIATATGVVKALAMGPIIGPIMAAVIGAMGAAQLAIIAGTTYSGGSSSAASTASNPSKLQVGRVGNSVNLDRVNSNAGGEVGYLRGTAGYGNSAANYRTIGSAYGGMTNRGYGPADLIVGEKGPERITTTAPMSVSPDVDNKKVENHNWTIQATDAESFERMLEKNPAAIIKGLQRVANSSGKSFMEDVDVKSFGGRKA